MNQEQLEKIMNNKIQKELEVWETELKDYLLKKIREVNLSHGFPLDDVIKHIKTTCLSDSIMEIYYSYKKRKMMEDIENKLIQLNWLFKNDLET